MRRLLKIAVYGLAGLIVILAVAGLILVQSPWFREKVRERMVYEAERATGGRVEIGKFDLDWRTLTATVRNFVIRGTEGPEQAPLFRADSIQVGLKIISLWKKQVDLQSVVAERPQVNVIVHADGSTNLPKPKVARKPGRGALQTVLDLAIKRFNLVDGTVQVQMRRTPLNVLGEDLRAQVFYEPAPARYRGDLSFRQLNVTPGQMKTLPFNVDASFVAGGNRLDITSAHVALRESRVDLKGTVENFAAPRGDFTYTAQIALADLPPGINLNGVQRRGTVALGGTMTVSGASAYALTGRVQAAGLVYEERGIHVRNIRVASELAITPGRIELNALNVSALRGQAAGRAEIVDLRRFRVEVAVRGFSVEELTHLEGIRHADWNGYLSGPVEVSGEIRRGGPTDMVVRARVGIAPAPGANPVEGSIDLSYTRRTGRIDFGPSYLATRFTRAQFSGALGQRLNVAAQSSDLDDLEPGIAMLTKGPPPPMPVKLVNGVAKFQGVVAGPLKDPRIQGHASLANFIWEDRRFDAAETDIVVSRTGVTAQNAVVRKQQIHVTGSVQIGFRNWKPEASEPMSGAFHATAPAADLLAEIGQKLPISGGSVTADGKLSGTIHDPVIEARAQACRMVANGQPVDSVQGQVRYTPALLQITSGSAQAGASVAQVSGTFEHPRDSWREGRLRFQLASKGVYLGQLKAVQERSPGLQGRVETQLAGEMTIDRTGFRPGGFNGWVGLRNLAVDQEPLGSLLLNAATKGTVLNAKLEGELAGSKVTGDSQWTLQGDYPAQGHVEFTPLKFSTLLAKLGRTFTKRQAPFEGFAAGRIDFSGSTLDPRSWKGSVRLPVFEIRPAADFVEVPNRQQLVLQNAGPIVVDLDTRGARVRQAQFQGKDTNLTVTGSVGFAVKNPWDLRVRGGVNLAMLRDFDSRLYSTGAVSMDVSIRGALARPDVFGQVDLMNTSLNYADFPNGIDHANGRIFLFRDRAIIEGVTAESGGGKISLGGFIGFGGVTTFHLQAKASDVRVRYPEGVSSSANAALNFTGTLDRSLLSGEVVVTRVGFNPRSDLGSLLAASAQPVRTPARPSRFEQGLHFDVHVVTSPQVRLETSLTRGIQAEADLRLRGDPIRPILLGRVLINQGEVIFYGNQYTINSGQITFLNASKIEPIVNMDLETRARGIDITLHISGPADKLNLSYRSDPPMQFSDLVGLLATGREPTLTPGLSGSQTQLSQSWQQAGASAILSQAIANPLAGRLQRFFGVSRLKIDPQITGVTTNNAAARVTLEQQVTNYITFTYITDLSRAQGQTIRVEWDFTRNWSGVVLREENGLFGIDFLYKKQFK